MAIEQNTRKPAPGPSDSIQVDLRLDQLAALDAWIADQPDPKPTRGQAIQRLLEQALGPGTAAAVPVEELTTQDVV
jgi:hypothetical protein